MKQSSVLGHGCAALANVIWGLMAPFAKVIMVGGLITPLVLTDLRVIGAAILFWCASFFAPRETVSRADLIRLFFASLFAITLNQGSYIFGVGLTTPGNATILTSTMPLWAMVLAAVLLKDPITLKKWDKIMADGIKNKICLDNVKIADLVGFPIAWKNIPDAICIPLNMVNIKNILNDKHANSLYKASPEPNIPINCSGIVWNNINATNETVKLSPNTILIVFFTLSYFLAP